MIKLDISSLIFFYTLFSGIIILVIWFLFGYKKGARPIDREDASYTWKCSVCFHSYIDSRHEEISVCPLCGSYNKKGEVKR